MENHFRFYVPIIICDEISQMKMRELVKLFRSEFLIYDIEKGNGIVFNLPDIIQCSMFGVCGIANSHEELLKILERTVNLMKNRILKNDNHVNKNNKINKNNLLLNLTRDNFNIDKIDFNDILKRLSHYIKYFKKKA
jgi:hypothetical protein